MMSKIIMRRWHCYLFSFKMYLIRKTLCPTPVPIKASHAFSLRNAFMTPIISPPGNRPRHPLAAAISLNSQTESPLEALSCLLVLSSSILSSSRSSPALTVGRGNGSRDVATTMGSPPMVPTKSVNRQMANGTGSKLWSPYSTGVEWSPVTQRKYWNFPLDSACQRSLASWPKARSTASNALTFKRLALSWPASSIAWNAKRKIHRHNEIEKFNLGHRYWSVQTNFRSENVKEKEGGGGSQEKKKKENLKIQTILTHQISLIKE